MNNGFLQSKLHTVSQTNSTTFFACLSSLPIHFQVQSALLGWFRWLLSSKALTQQCNKIMPKGVNFNIGLINEYPLVNVECGLGGVHRLYACAFKQRVLYLHCFFENIANLFLSLWCYCVTKFRGGSRKFRKRRARPPPNPPPNKNFTFRDMQHTAM